MATSGSGAVFFLGTRAHYQVLQPPESHFDAENGNTSTETIYRNPSVQESRPADQAKVDVENECYANDRWGYYDQGEVNDVNDKTDNASIKRWPRRRPSETTLCERDADMKPALLNNLGDNSTLKTKSSRSRVSLLTFLTSLTRRKRRLDKSQTQYLHHIESVLNSCTYRESCRCLDCQSRYFECDDSDEYNSSDDSEYATQYVTHVDEPEHEPPRVDEDDDEVFIDAVPEDNTSTDMLLENKEKMSVSSDEALEEAMSEEDKLNLEVAAGTPVLLNYLLTHPITCAIQ